MCWQFILITVGLTKATEFHSTSIEIVGNNVEGYNESLYVEKRLPHDVVPIAYTIAISPNFSNDEFHGSVRIDIEILKARSNIVLHAKDLTIVSARLYLHESLVEVPIEFILPVEKYEMIVIKPTKMISSGKYILTMNFRGNLRGKIHGFYLSTYANFNEPVRKLAVTQFEPFYARTAFPCFDEPSFKSVFLIRIVHSEGPNYRALSNMPIRKVEKVRSNGDETVTFFDPSPPMSAYLVAFVVSDFECLASSMNRLNGSTVPLNICVRSVYKAKAKFALNVAVRVMEYYSRIFNIDYPLPKLDLVAIPDFAAGAMENWGLITFRETEVLHSEDHSSCDNTKRVSLTVAHELAHMWFGNLVTMKWWNDLWLNEGFATYMEHVAVDSIFPEWNQMEHFSLYTKYISMKHDGKSSSRPIISHVEYPEEIDGMFDRISYQKAAAVIRMLVDAFGIRNFVYGIRNYLERYQFRNTESRDLFEILRDNTRGSVDIVMFANRWMKFPGFPVVNARQDNGVLALSQRRFAMNEKLPGTFEYETEYKADTWDIPIKYITSRKEDGVKLNWFPANFSCAELSLEKPVDWIKLNHGSVGYYVVNYTVEAWSAFRDLLSRNYQTLNPTDRANLLHDAFLLARSGDLCYCTAMNLSSYLVNETAYQPWAVAAEWLVQANRLLYATNVHARFQRYARSLVDRIYREVGWHVRHRETLVNRELRAVILNAACSIGHEHCLKLAGRKLRRFLTGTDVPPNDVRSTVYSFGLVTQLDDVGLVFENMSQLHRKEIDPQEKERLMVGLAGVRDKSILNRYLEESMKEEFVRKQNFCELLIRIALNPTGVNVVWDFIRSNWNSLAKKYPTNDYTLGRAIVTIVSLFKDERKLKEAKQFFKRYSNVGVSKNARRSAIEEIESNINWLRANVNKINRWLRVNGYDRIGR